MKTDALLSYLEATVQQLNDVANEIRNQRVAQASHVRRLLEGPNPLVTAHAYLDHYLINDQADTDFYNLQRAKASEIVTKAASDLV